MPKKITSKRGGSRKLSAGKKTQKRGKNKFFKTMLDAKKKGLKSFKYKIPIKEPKHMLNCK